MTRIFYDTEFVDAGNYIDLVSIGMITEHGDKYYAVNRNVRWEKIAGSEEWMVWLRKNVWPKLPVTSPGAMSINIHHPDVKDKVRIASEVSNFVLKAANGYGDPVELWADWPSYDHVVLCQLFGRMRNLPLWFPSRTNCLTQLAEDWGVDIQQAPTQEPALAHHALQDAIHDRILYQWIWNEAVKLGVDAPRKQVAQPS